MSTSEDPRKIKCDPNCLRLESKHMSVNAKELRHDLRCCRSIREESVGSMEPGNTASVVRTHLSEIYKRCMHLCPCKINCKLGASNLTHVRTRFSFYVFCVSSNLVHPVTGKTTTKGDSLVFQTSLPCDLVISRSYIQIPLYNICHKGLFCICNLENTGFFDYTRYLVVFRWQANTSAGYLFYLICSKLNLKVRTLHSGESELPLVVAFFRKSYR